MKFSFHERMFKRTPLIMSSFRIFILKFLLKMYVGVKYCNEIPCWGNWTVVAAGFTVHWWNVIVIKGFIYLGDLKKKTWFLRPFEFLFFCFKEFNWLEKCLFCISFFYWLKNLYYRKGMCYNNSGWGYRLLNQLLS